MNKELRQNQLIIDNVRRLMNEYLERIGLNEAKLLEFDLVEDFNDEVYLVSKIIMMQKDSLTLSDTFKLVDCSTTGFVRAYLADHLLVSRLNKCMSEDTVKSFFIY